VKNKSHFKIQSTVEATRIHSNNCSLKTNAEHGMQLQQVGFGIWCTCQFRICTYISVYVCAINDQLRADEVQ